MVLLALTKGLYIDDDLVLFVDGRHTVVALDGAFTGGHFGRPIVGDVAFDFVGRFSFPQTWGSRL